MIYPPVSIVVITRNRAEKLPRVIAMLENQDYPQNSIELLIVDNGSTDHTAEQIRSLMAASKLQIRYVYEPRLGVTHARNRGAAEAANDFIAYIDDDCIFGDDWLRQLMRGFDLHSNVSAVGGLVQVHWDKERPRWLSPKVEEYLGTTGYLGNQARLLESNERIVEFNLAIKKKAWKAGGGFQGIEQLTGQHVTAGEIHPLLMELRKEGFKIAYTPDAIVSHQVSHRATVRWLLWRSYWQGITDAIFASIYQQDPRKSVIVLLAISFRGALLEFVKTIKPLLKNDLATAMTRLVNCVAYIGRIVGEIRIASGGFKSAQDHVTTN